MAMMLASLCCFGGAGQGKAIYHDAFDARAKSSAAAGQWIDFRRLSVSRETIY
jgi:hypothetical protein